MPIISEMLEHVMDLSQLIVDRNTLFSCIVPMMKSDDNRLQTLNCLFVMFNNYLIELKEYKHTLISTEYPDLVMVRKDAISKNAISNRTRSFDPFT